MWVQKRKRDKSREEKKRDTTHYNSLYLDTSFNQPAQLPHPTSRVVSSHSTQLFVSKELLKHAIHSLPLCLPLFPIYTFSVSSLVQQVSCFSSCLLTWLCCFFAALFLFIILLVSLSHAVCLFRRKSISGNWKANVGSSVLEQVPVTERYKKWLDEVSNLFDGLDMLTVEAVADKDGREIIYEVTGSQMPLMGESQEEDRKLIAELICNKMNGKANTGYAEFTFFYFQPSLSLSLSLSLVLSFQFNQQLNSCHPRHGNFGRILPFSSLFRWLCLS